MLGKKTAIVVSTLVAAGILAGAAPAAAEAGTPTAPRAAAVPSCVTTSLNDDGATDYLTVRNGCSYSVRVKVVLANATDFACQSIPSGGSHNYQWPWPGRFDRLADC
ncbi:hypothetical protein ACFPZ0_14145 [Streptomonospora nanhaiensis]|uniref:Uncharacterized protein n=1 Tax=Streptomonospora nanhaiensis TaxID=1323731 RepID=A0A853BM11_9ACTN|nr:hypothetical protein [Streptomonospora nanhaiensis]MBV2363342.1 hypothetical protein [Streptomonospora nanhaiensis]MBX9388518.1 hypothetical protein [Streptomonospora nanhaiensis]NYI95707.1 hypothetical protein [Streptomonospora nanhaiensis]